MTTPISVSVYGYLPLEEDKQYLRNRLFNYIKLLIQAEQSNPYPDYEGEKQLHLIKQVAQSDLLQHQRQELIAMLLDETEDEYED